MKLYMKNDGYDKKYAELLPSIAINWRKPLVICIGWIIWFIFIEF